METVKIKTPGKINFGLNILRKRSDGYHDIETIFYPINLFDILTVSSYDSFAFECNNKELSNDFSNSVLIAVQLLEIYSNQKFNVKISLEKHIPIGAGMGGGSSDGAAALIALNKFYKLSLTSDKLKDLALNIGSDSPFFVDPSPSFAQSRGEIIQKINLSIPYPILIVNPGIHISTKWAYENLQIKFNKKFNLDLITGKTIDFSKLRNEITNDFEEIVFPNFPEIEKIKKQLYENDASFALMTGTGSTVFGIFPDIASAQTAKENFSKNYFTFIHVQD